MSAPGPERMRLAAIACDLYADEFPESIDPADPARARDELLAASEWLCALADRPAEAKGSRASFVEAVALALISGRWEDGAAEFVPQEIWDGLYDAHYLRNEADPTGETWPVITRLGEDRLAHLIADFGVAESASPSGVTGEDPS